MTGNSREYPEKPVVGIGGVVIEDGRALLIRRGGEPLRGQWSIPGGTLELGESLEQGVVRELLEETGLQVRILRFIEVFDRIFVEPSAAANGPRFHFVIIDYLCERISGKPQAGGDALELAFAAEDDLERFQLTATATRVLRKAFALYHQHQGGQRTAG